MKTMKKRILTLVLIALLGLPATASAAVSTIHAGHGGIDPGAIGSRYREADVARTITNKMLAVTGAVDATDNTAVSVNDNLNKIVNKVNANAGVQTWNISNHLNSASLGATGVEVFYYSKDPEAKEKAEKVSAAISQALGIPNRGAKVGDHLFVIRNTTGKMLLIEWAFISNPSDMAKLLGNMDVAVNRVLNQFGYGNTIINPGQPNNENNKKVNQYWLYWNVGTDFSKVQNYRVNMNKFMKVDYSDIYYNQNADGTWSIGITNLDLNGLQNYRLQLMQRYGLVASQMNGQEFFVDSYLVGYKGITLKQLQNLRVRWMNNEKIPESKIAMIQEANGTYSLYTRENSFRQVQHRRIMLDRLNPDLKISEQRHYELEK
ncbi:N-acetylmuramoyl-L-alanine amidase [Carnobacterium maltaromaticum]|uniref:N-acetylmuramoyl-L-alanine amidase n=1 Tax=Carnobacterium maltaromaticum TaxID=2751 RepID=A0AAW9KAY7_CARML|nr:N-acetylmuramoyl-L-alanine amidase [Carnobacterium maltaromaticum]MDZ5759328.1 N-acetylmuramoyl-L-alanine amidase [Carnobacterium maltaromaticum]